MSKMNTTKDMVKDMVKDTTKDTVKDMAEEAVEDAVEGVGWYLTVEAWVCKHGTRSIIHT